MERMLRNIATTLTMALLAVIAPTSCTLIDDDRSDCDTEFNVHYSVTLRTNLTAEVKTVLRNRFETEVADLLEDSLKNVFREYATDVDLSFYHRDSRLFHQHSVMEAEQRVYELTLPADDYRHLALANIGEEHAVSYDAANNASTAYLTQTTGDTIRGHHTGLFTARKDMDVHSGENQTFDVTLYMVNCASILVLRTDNVSYRDCQVYSSDFADGFYVSDSLFTHTTNPMVHDHRITTPPVEREVFYAVTFPSCDTAAEAQAATRAADDYQTGGTDENRIWRKYVYVTLPDGSVTRTVINVSMPLQAGNAMIVYAYMQPNGGVYSPNVDVTTSVQLNWKDGLIIK